MLGLVWVPALVRMENDRYHVNARWDCPNVRQDVAK